MAIHRLISLQITLCALMIEILSVVIIDNESRIKFKTDIIHPQVISLFKTNYTKQISIL